MGDVNQHMEYLKPITIRRKAGDTRNYGNFGMGWFGVILGSGLFLTFGLALSLGLLGYMGGLKVKAWSIIPIWLFFMVGCPTLVAYSIRNIIRAKRFNAVVTEDGKPAWDWDHDWVGEQKINRFWRSTIRNSIAGLGIGYVIFALMVPGFANLDKMDGDPIAVYAVGGLFGGFWLLCMGVGVAAIPVDYMLRDFHIKYARIPYFVGNKVHIQVRLPEKIVEKVKQNQSTALKAELRLIEEAVTKETRRDMDRRRRTVYSVEFFQCWGQAIQIDHLKSVMDDKGRLVLSWDVPEDLPGNDLTGACVRTWQLSLKTKYGIFPVKQHYLVPIYEKRDARSADK